MKGFKIEGQLMPPTLKVDGSATIKFATGELSKDDINTLLDHKMELGWLLFSPNEIQESDIPTEQADGGGKSTSQIVYNRLLRYYMTKIDKEGVGFQDWQKRQRLAFSQKYLDQLN